MRTIRIQTWEIYRSPAPGNLKRHRALTQQRVMRVNGDVRLQKHFQDIEPPESDRLTSIFWNGANDPEMNQRLPLWQNFQSGGRAVVELSGTGHRGCPQGTCLGACLFIS